MIEEEAADVFKAWFEGEVGSGCAGASGGSLKREGVGGASGLALGIRDDVAELNLDGIEGTADEPTLPDYNRPEVEINGGAITGSVLRIAVSNTRIERIAIYNNAGSGSDRLQAARALEIEETGG